MNHKTRYRARKIICIQRVVYDWINRHPIWLGISILPTAVYDVIRFGYKYVRDYNYRHRSQIHDVIMFNEQSFACIFDHHKHEHDGIPFKCPNEYCSQRSVERITEQLGRARVSIDLAMYTFNSLEIIDALKAALRRDIKVRIVTNNRFSPFDDNFKCLMRMGARVRLPDSTKLMHHKFCVIDGCERVAKLLKERISHLQLGRTTCVAISGSANWTNSGFAANMENCLITSNTLITSQLEMEFNRMWRAFRSQR